MPRSKTRTAATVDRRGFLKVGVAAIGAMPGALRRAMADVATEPAGSKPNFILTDDQGIPVSQN
jgi:hypothetical protein